MQQKNRVYKFDCADCKKWYIGETGQKMESRKYQHQNDVKNGKKTNAFFVHLETHNTHSIRWQEVVYLENEEDWKSVYRIMANSTKDKRARDRRARCAV